QKAASSLTLQQCRLECYQRFQARASTATETSVKPDACDSPPSG
ncbi:TPA: DUF3330 domain-containing protein, partial [Escherichia coli]|nr:DUF3330 domain-containing protein [Escherichia coli]